MATLEALRIKNLRSLEDTGWISQKPITILVGKNSAGKSTYARVFPLLRQSAISKRRSPILWYGQYVDFGQFSTAVHNHENDRKIEFQFRISLTPEEVADDYLSYRASASLRSRITQRKFLVDVSVRLRPGESSETADSAADSLTVSSEGIVAEFRFDKNGTVEIIRVDGQEIWRSKAGEISHVSYEAMLPTLRFFKEKRATDEAGEREVFLEDFDPYSPQLISKVRSHVHGNLGEDKLKHLVSRLGFGSDEYFYQASLSAGLGHRTWIDYIQGGRSDRSRLLSLKKAVYAARLPSILSAINKHLTRQFGAVKYVEPLRATAQRYYRKQDLAIDELDPKGGNVAQFLQGLPAWRKRSFDDLSMNLFGFIVQPRIQGGHIELLLEQAGDQKLINLADAGVGFSQMLPILLQVWAATTDEGLRQSRAVGAYEPYLVIEQPELHLHPAYQAVLADLLCEVSRGDSSRRKGRMVVETHSPALVNRLGTLISEQRLSSEDVQIVIFEQDDVKKVTTLRLANFDSLGNLENWPFGFFEPEV